MDLEFVPGWGSITISKTNDSVETMIKETSGLDKKEEIIFDGKSAFKLSGSSGIASSVQFINIVTDHQNITYIISLTSQDDQLFPVFTSEFDQILSTFKFVGQNN
ncbi:hypothetical protein A2690_04295 [Candidatus Roizmanbacteria bacterium RIFCSPHIGHO2_01_FULL_39_12b]|uniref:PsbP C-terminal domain-containing protein n=1 Tax=Candidatus Roizmanbacteria bacterium RIFCSPHIGHO2_01_FULL_39_12b TaxID=1802030 RepID=A0A1F7GC48_9BACT|nr:MAG: hypothetical protein A2690_04295 [Candidatus Roizmanbacteria bacterium RIFCSPHIGHO2_01_FULL_39_12b]OGK47161.1 MAG: hypothetical protein A3B46_02020 [Candidatus Roizmanbacteria bacterium RIFCSPLOWO2_01_FULL_39_19]